MSFIAAAVVGGAATLGGAAIGAVGANSAAKTQADAATQASQLQQKMFEEQRADAQPWRQAGAQALSQLQDPSLMRSFSMSDFQQDPGYQFRMDEGQKALERSAAARGGLQSGAFDKALSQYGQNFASNEYQNAYNRFNNDQANRFNRLSSIAGVGQTANAQIGQAGMQTAGQIGQNMMGAANASGAAQIAGANAIGQGLSGLGKIGQNYATMSWLNQPAGGASAAAAAPMAQAPMAASDFGSFAFT